MDDQNDTRGAPARLGVVDRYLGRGDRARLAALVTHGAGTRQTGAGGAVPEHTALSDAARAHAAAALQDTAGRARAVRQDLAGTLERLVLAMQSDFPPSGTEAALSLRHVASELASVTDELARLADRIDTSGATQTGRHSARRLDTAA